MATRLSENSARSDLSSRTRVLHISSRFLAFVALTYALLAGLHTLQDFDLGWQLATGRWVVQHHHIFSTDVFSYTASGQPWMYPIVSGIIFYLAFLAGGYGLLSWFGAIACAGTVALLRPNNFYVSALAIVAVPLIANRTQPRAEMFTTILFAAFLTLLWQHYRGGRSRLWLLPILMVFWANLHLGFVAGLALCITYVVLEVFGLLFSAHRAPALARLRKSWPWLALTAAATLINPWGPWIYIALFRQQRAQGLHNAWIVEWGNIRPSWAGLHQALEWRDPQSCFWWLIFVAVLAAGIAAWRKHWGEALLLLASAYFTIQHIRMQGLFACLVVVVGGTLFDELTHSSKEPPGILQLSLRPAQLIIATVLIATTALSALATARSWDLISDRYYMRSTQLSLFGTGLSWWFPERAAKFLEREKLPANLFNTYAVGGYLTWRLFPAYRDYIDGRALPFGPQLFFRAYNLSVQPPDSSAWQQEADARGINTILVPLSRYAGMTLFPQLHAFCRSKSWRPVYMDEVSAIFVRSTSQTAALLDRLQIDCEKVSFDPPSSLNAAASPRTKAELFNFLANAGGVLYSLERYPEALASLDRAQSIFGESGSLHLLHALVLQQSGRPTEAEAEFLTSLRLEPNDETWLDLGLFYMTQKRYSAAAEVFRQSAESSSRPHEMWMMLGQADLQLHQPEPALAAFDRAVASSPFGAEGESLGATFYSLIATGRAKAWYQLGDVPQAVSFQEEAVKLAPGDSRLWLGLADLYEAQGRSTLAAQAKQRAKDASTR